jgi:predicted MPP superfamily phosphohydrolase
MFRTIKLFIYVFFIPVAGLLGAWAFWFEPSQLVVRDYELEISGAPLAGLSGLKIAVISDVHAGAPFINAEKIATIVDDTNAAKPDIILLLGDYVQHVLGGTDMPFEIVATILGDLKAPLGVYAVLGNHDWGENYGVIARTLNAAGLTVVDDRSLVIQDQTRHFYLVGFSDYYKGPHDMQKALQNVPQGQKVLCITHTPDLFPELPPSCLLTLAGHTHGGQVDLPFLGRLIVPSKYGARYAAGLVEEQGRYLFTSTGIGTSIIPVRFRVTPEISVLDIR